MSCQSLSESLPVRKKNLTIYGASAKVYIEFQEVASFVNLD